MKKLLFILAVLISASSCKKDNPGKLTVNPCGVSFYTTVHYLAIGDEFSEGFSIAQSEAWPSKVLEYLEENGEEDIQFSSAGQEGFTSSALSSFITDNSITECNNLSTVMVGVHDLLEGLSVADFKADYAVLIDSSIAFTGQSQRVTCVGLPDFSDAPGLPVSAGTPSEAKAKIQSYNAAILEVSQEKGVQFADIFPISEVSYSAMLVDDEFHPNADQHLLWSNVISGAVENGLD